MRDQHDPPCVHLLLFYHNPPCASSIYVCHFTDLNWISPLALSASFCKDLNLDLFSLNVHHSRDFKMDPYSFALFVCAFSMNL